MAHGAQIIVGATQLRDCEFAAVKRDWIKIAGAVDANIGPDGIRQILAFQLRKPPSRDQVAAIINTVGGRVSFASFLCCLRLVPPKCSGLPQVKLVLENGFYSIVEVQPVEEQNQTEEALGKSGCDSRSYDKILFLDVDGVLHPYSARDNEEHQFRQDCMQRLKRIVDETGCKVVLSSAWRHSARDTAIVNRQLERYDIEPVISTTRIGDDEFHRHDDILEWVERNPTNSWVAVDDMHLHQLREHYVGTVGEIGLSDANADQAIKILNTCGGDGPCALSRTKKRVLEARFHEFSTSNTPPSSPPMA